MNGDDEQAEQETAHRARRQVDRDDFIRERAGNQVAKMNRFTRPDQTPEGLEARRQARDRHFWSSMTAAQRERLADMAVRLGELDRASVEALDAAERRVRQAEQHLERLREAAAVDRLGRRVYRAADGRVFFEDGSELTPDESAGIAWRTSHTSWETRRDAVRRHDEAMAGRDDIVRYRDRLDHARDRIEGGEDLSDEELNDLEAGMDAMPGAVSERLAARRPAQSSVARQYVGDGLATGERASEAFRRAGTATGEPAPDPKLPPPAPPSPA